MLYLYLPYIWIARFGLLIFQIKGTGNCWIHICPLIIHRRCMVFYSQSATPTLDSLACILNCICELSVIYRQSLVDRDLGLLGWPLGYQEWSLVTLWVVQLYTLKKMFGCVRSMVDIDVIGCRSGLNPGFLLGDRPHKGRNTLAMYINERFWLLTNIEITFIILIYHKTNYFELILKFEWHKTYRKI